MQCRKDGSWGTECLGEITPSKERCDGRGIDEDCDGLADLKDNDCKCIDGSIRDCIVPGALGDCSLGRSKCQDGSFGACEPRFLPSTESCGTRSNPEPGLAEPTGDEDCDGLENESDHGNKFMPAKGIRYMLDEDQDGWGAMKGSNLIRRYCSASQVPPNYTLYNPTKQTDCGDCPGELGREVNPGVTGFHINPSKCLQDVNWSGGTFDYNCSGKIETPQGFLTDTFQCRMVDVHCEGVAGWVTEGGAPQCGRLGHWKKADQCYVDSGKCEELVAPPPTTNIKCK